MLTGTSAKSKNPLRYPTKRGHSNKCLAHCSVFYKKKTQSIGVLRHRDGIVRQYMHMSFTYCVHYFNHKWWLCVLQLSISKNTTDCEFWLWIYLPGPWKLSGLWIL